jgi:hypothetical protein
MRIFKTKWFVRYARREKIKDAALKEAVSRAEKGIVDGDLGGGIIKQRSRGRGKDGQEATALFSPIALASSQSFSTASPRATARISKTMNCRLCSILLALGLGRRATILTIR